jgi:hypothetical protein
MPAPAHTWHSATHSAWNRPPWQARKSLSLEDIDAYQAGRAWWRSEWRIRAAAGGKVGTAAAWYGLSVARIGVSTAPDYHTAGRP